MAIPNNNNLLDRHTEKISKYRDLEEQTRRQWKLKDIKTIPIVISSTGLIPKKLLENLRKLQLDENIYKVMQKAVLLGTARTVRKYMGNAEEHRLLRQEVRVEQESNLQQGGEERPGPDHHHEPENLERAPTELNPFDI